MKAVQNGIQGLTARYGIGYAGLNPKTYYCQVFLLNMASDVTLCEASAFGNGRWWQTDQIIAQIND